MNVSLSPVVVAIPAKDERELLPLCLSALARQTGIAASGFEVVVSCNNCSDGSPDMLRALAAALPYRLHVVAVVLPPAIAHAGGARRHALDAAAQRCAAGGLLLTTDADAIPDDNWVAATVAAFQDEIAAVAGRVSTDWETLRHFPADVLDVGAREWEYQLLSAELEALGDPEPHNMWPRHNQACGANAAIRHEWYQRIGGLPVIRTGEDRAMFDAVWRRDGKIRHDMISHVTVSARLVGRAQGGMADALSARHGDAYLCDDLLEPADDLDRRTRWRHSARIAHAQGKLVEWGRILGVDLNITESAAKAEAFGEAWLMLEAQVPALTKRRLTPASLDPELRRIRQLLASSRSDLSPLPALPALSPLQALPALQALRA